jgi:ATP-dependent Clp protease ATP-binding subunit ClpB
LVVTDAATAKLAHDGYDSAFGARPLKRLIQKQVGDRLAMAILDGSVAEGTQVTLDVVDGSFALI